MSTYATEKLLTAFGEVLVDHRNKRQLTVSTLATATRLSESHITSLERGDREPTLTEFFRIAWALGEEPVILFIDVVSESRKNPHDLGLYKSRASDFARLYRLGYYHDPGDFREHPTTYHLINHATHAARELNTTRGRKELPPLDTLLIYVRLGYLNFRPDPNDTPEGQQSGAT